MTITSSARKSVDSWASAPTRAWQPVSSTDTATIYQDHTGRLIEVRRRIRQPQSPAIIAPVPPAGEPGAAVEAKPKTKRAKVTKAPKAKREKKQPSGKYPNGYCLAPITGRFDGSKPGPGRPKKSVSQDTILRKLLVQTRPVAVAGRSSKLQAREIASMMLVNKALSGDRHALKEVQAHALRLFADNDNHGGKSQAAADQPTDLDAADQAILAAYEAKMLSRILGEPDGDDEDLDEDDASAPDDAPEE